MITCSNCNRKQKEEAKFCADCGAKLETAEKELSAEGLTPIEESVVEEKEAVEEQTNQPQEVKEERVESPGDKTPEGQPEELAIPTITTDKTEAVVESVEEKGETTLLTSGKRPMKKGLMIGVIVALIVLVVGGIFGYKYLTSRPIDVLSDVKVTFSGYQTVGTAAYNDTQINKLVKEAALKKAGIPKKEAAALVKKDKEMIKKYDAEAELKKKVTVATALAKKVEVKLSSTTDLSNGKKITVSVLDKNVDDQKIVKEDSKKVEAKGLAELKEVTMDDVLKDVKYSFEGFNGHGELIIDDNPYEDVTKKLFADISSDGRLSNDDSVELKLNRKVATEMLKDGKKLTGKTTASTKVSGLKDPMEVGKLDECLTKIDELTKKHYDGITFADLNIDDAELKNLNVDMTFKIDREESYMRIHDGILSDEVSFDIQSVYKIGVTMKANGQSVSETFYAVHRYPIVPLKGDNLDYDSAFILNTVFEPTLKEALAELNADNLDYKKIEKK